MKAEKCIFVHEFCETAVRIFGKMFIFHRFREKRFFSVRNLLFIVSFLQAYIDILCNVYTNIAFLLFSDDFYANGQNVESMAKEDPFALSHQC